MKKRVLVLALYEALVEEDKKSNCLKKKIKKEFAGKTASSVCVEADEQSVEFKRTEMLEAYMESDESAYCFHYYCT